MPPTVLIVALIAITVIWVILKGYLREKADQHIFYRKDHRDGRQLVAAGHQRAVTLTAPTTLDERLRRPVEHAVPGSTHRRHRSPTCPAH